MFLLVVLAPLLMSLVAAMLLAARAPVDVLKRDHSPFLALAGPSHNQGHPCVCVPFGLLQVSYLAARTPTLPPEEGVWR